MEILSNKVVAVAVAVMTVKVKTIKIKTTTTIVKIKKIIIIIRSNKKCNKANVKVQKKTEKAVITIKALFVKKKRFLSTNFSQFQLLN